MKDKTIAYALYIALGLLVVVLAISVFLPYINQTIKDATRDKYNLPTPSPIPTISYVVPQESPFTTYHI